jgi:hypothetical protein
MEDQVNITTYIAIAQSLFQDDPSYYDSRAQDAILSFAKYLDSGRELGPELQVLALKQARKIDGEVLQACIDRFGREAMIEVVQGVYAKHRHTKVQK